MKDLLIDVGSTFIKYAFSGEGSFSSGRIPFPERMPMDAGCYFVEREAIERAITAIVDKGKTAGCERLFFSVQMHGFLWRKKDGSLSHYVSWRDKSGDTTDERFASIDFHALGTALKRNLPLCKQSLWGEGIEFFTLGSYLSYFLTGSNATHLTDACASGFFDAETGKPISYASDIKMPRVHLDVSLVGMHGPLAVYSPCGDHQVSFLGSGAQADGYLLNIGTATQLSCLYNAREFPSSCEARPYFQKGVRLLTVSGLTGGEMLYKGLAAEQLLDELSDVLTFFPPKRTVLIGGGGADGVFPLLKDFFEERGISAQRAAGDIGTEGLKMIADKKVRVGTMLSEIAFPSFPLIAKNTELDFIIVDNEHGAFDYSTLSGLCMNASLVDLPLIVRLPDNSRASVTKTADMGAGGFLLPMVNGAKDIEAVVKYARYAPIGERGVSTTRAHTHYAPPPLKDYMQSANERVKVYAQIETTEGVAHIDEILAVHGVDGVFVGPNDLSVSLNCIGEKEPIIPCLERIAAACARVHKPWGIITTDQELIACAKRLSVDMVSCGSELNMLINGCKKIKSDLK